MACVYVKLFKQVDPYIDAIPCLCFFVAMPSTVLCVRDMALLSVI